MFLEKALPHSMHSFANKALSRCMPSCFHWKIMVEVGGVTGSAISDLRPNGCILPTTRGRGPGMTGYQAQTPAGVINALVTSGDGNRDGFGVKAPPRNRMHGKFAFIRTPYLLTSSSPPPMPVPLNPTMPCCWSGRIEPSAEQRHPHSQSSRTLLCGYLIHPLSPSSSYFGSGLKS